MRAWHTCRYGSRALELLRRYYEGDLADVVGNAADSDDEEGGEAGDEDAPSASAAARHANGTSNGGVRRGEGAAEGVPLQEEVIAPRGGLPPLLVSRLLHEPFGLQHRGSWMLQDRRDAGATRLPRSQIYGCVPALLDLSGHRGTVLAASALATSDCAMRAAKRCIDQDCCTISNQCISNQCIRH